MDSTRQTIRFQFVPSTWKWKWYRTYDDLTIAALPVRFIISSFSSSLPCHFSWFEYSKLVIYYRSYHFSAIINKNKIFFKNNAVKIASISRKKKILGIFELKLCTLKYQRNEHVRFPILELQFEVFLRYFWDPFRVHLRSFLRSFEVLLRSFWGPFEVIWGFHKLEFEFVRLLGALESIEIKILNFRSHEFIQ